MMTIGNDYAGRAVVPTQPLHKPEARKVSDLPEDQQAAIRASHAESYARLAEHHRKMEEMDKNFQALQKGEEVRSIIAPNVSGMTKDQALRQIEYMSELIQSGEAEKTTLFTGKGTQATSNFRQYVYWMQQHVKALDGAGQSTLAQA
jgi:hypothetical protein